MNITYLKQSINDAINVLNVFGEAFNAASRESYDLPTFGVIFIANIDPQNLAETVSDYMNSERITQEDVSILIMKNNQAIKDKKSQIKGYQAELKSYETEMDKLKKEMNNIGKY